MSTRFVCFGELLLRLGAPGRERLLQSPRLDVHVGGAEANVAVALAHFGNTVALISVLPDNALGSAALGEMRRHGVDTTRVRRGAGRMGLYFLETGAMHRPSDVLYDRADSAFARAAAQDYDWPALLAGANVLHLSGVTPAVSENAARAVLQAAQAARRLGIRVVFDGNFRGKLWQARGAEPAGVLRELFACADLLLADHRDIGLVLDRDFAGDQAAAAAAAFDAFPSLVHIAATLRTQHSVDHHELGAVLFTRQRRIDAGGCPITPIVDRIGAGDAFAAGLLHGLFGGMAEQESLQFALAAACLKHSLPGDALRMSATEVGALSAERRYDVRR